MTERSRGIAVAGAHRTVRVLAEGEGPYDGELVTCRNGMALRVDAAQLHGWAGWVFAGAEHVAAPLDVALRPDGQDVLLPWCVRTVRAHLAQTADTGGIGHGEAVTLAVSVLRGVLELEVPQDAPSGERSAGARSSADDEAEGGLDGGWWLTDEARPLFAIGAADSPGAGGSPRETGERLLRDLEARIEDRALRRVLTRLADALDDPRRLRVEAARWESELLEIAAPRALRLDVGGVPEPDDGSQRRDTLRTSPHGGDRPPRRRDLRTAARDDGRREVVAQRNRPAGAKGRHARGRRSSAPGPLLMLRLRDALGHVRERTGRVMPFRRTARVQSRLPASRPDRSVERKRWRGPVLVAVSAAAVIAVVGALWPSGTGSADAADRPSTATPAVPSSTGRPPLPSPSPTLPDRGGATPAAPVRTRTLGASAQSDPRAAGEELIAAGRNCEVHPQPECAEVWDGGATTSRHLREADEPPVLIEDYGDIAAIRNASEEGAQMVVIIRRDAEWRIRDVYDIANPPSEGTGAP
ncbi:hypothetical protein [Microbacterium sp. 2MCAF23]|uniref:hypothetical protein n=1 Tax=Microbacterium sp. 2MCAF23 TaxID=3232985 RepID=UPI003F982C40